MGSSSSHRPHVVLGVSGGIAAYKACELLRRLTESGHDVTVVPTAAALTFVGAATWEALSGRRVTTDPFTNVHQVPHVRLGQTADLVLVAPATADLMARAAHGHADDLLTSILLTARCPVVFAPAMHTEMWEHAATRANVETLRGRGCLVVEPAYGRLTGSETGPGRLPEPAEILAVAVDVLARGTRLGSLDLAGRRIVVTAGGTREYLDPVRFLGNSSSGRQGYALARAAVGRGADVTLVAANVTLPDPAGVKVVPVVSTQDLRDAVLESARDADAVVMAAAPADFRPLEPQPHKIKKRADRQAPSLDLVENPDILLDLAAARSAARRQNTGSRAASQVLVGFAAETGDETDDVLGHARRKLQRKGCDLLVVNDVGSGDVFGSDSNQAVLLDDSGGELAVGRGPKDALAQVVWDQVLARLSGPAADPGAAAGETSQSRPPGER